MALSFPVAPMKATMGSTGAVPEGDDWAYEIKWDGYRTVVHVDGDRIRMQSGVGSPHQTVLYLFDVLQIDGTDTVGLGYLDRRRLLLDLVEPGSNWAVPSHSIGGGAELVAATVERELEGVIAKRVDSTYRPGTRTKEWRKIKNRLRATLAIGGVGTGFDQRTLASLTAQLDTLRTDACPFDPPPPPAVGRSARWVTPTLGAVLEIAEFTDDGLVRHASFVGLADPHASQ